MSHAITANMEIPCHVCTTLSAVNAVNVKTPNPVNTKTKQLSMPLPSA